MTGRQKLANMPNKADVNPNPHREWLSIGGKTYECLPVLLLRFDPQSPQNLYGKSSCTSVTSNRADTLPRSHHTIDFLPELAQFRVVFHNYSSGEAMIDMVPLHRVFGWTPFEHGETYLVPGVKA